MIRELETIVLTRDIPEHGLRRGDIEAERFIALIQREPFDYTKWRQGLDEDLPIEEISKKAMVLRMKHTEQANGADTQNG